MLVVRNMKRSRLKQISLGISAQLGSSVMYEGDDNDFSCSFLCVHSTDIQAGEHCQRDPWSKRYWQTRTYPNYCLNRTRSQWQDEVRKSSEAFRDYANPTAALTKSFRDVSLEDLWSDEARFEWKASCCNALCPTKHFASSSAAKTSAEVQAASEVKAKNGQP